jgi:hypothetical protein
VVVVVVVVHVRCCHKRTVDDEWFRCFRGG